MAGPGDGNPTQQGHASTRAAVIQAGRDAAVELQHASGTGAARASTGGYANSGVHVGDVNLRTGAPVRTRYRFQVQQIAPRRLLDREAELLELAEFARSPEAGGCYRWWQAGAWAGKTALMSWFVLNPPPGVRVVPFFVTARLPGQSDRAAFVEAVLEQVLTLLGEQVPPLLTPATREAHLLGLLAELARVCRARGETLLLVVDGLDEDRGYSTHHDAHSVAALLPAVLPDGMRVIVTGRPDPPIPGDVDQHHPLREPAVVRTLEISPHALTLRQEMERDLKRLLAATAVERDMLGLMTASGGGLTVEDLAALTGTGQWQVRDHLETSTGRSFARRPGDLALDGAPDVYLLGHEEIHVAAQRILEPVLHAYRARIDSWAEDYHRRGWPAGTPEYLLRGYHAMVMGVGDLDRATWLCTDAHRHDRLLAVTGGDSAALTQISATLDAHVARQPPDLPAVARLAVHRDHLRDRNANVPAVIPALWIRLGRHDRGMALVRSTAGPHQRVRALVHAARALARGGFHEQVASVLDEAVETARSITDPDSVADPDPRSRELAFVVEALLEVGDPDKAVDVAGSITAPSSRSEALARAASALPAPGRRGQASELRDQALSVALSISSPWERSWALATVVEALLSKADGRGLLAEVIDQSSQAVHSILVPDARSRAWACVATALTAVGHRDAAGDALDQALEAANTIDEIDSRNRSLGCVVEALATAGHHGRITPVINQAVEAARSVTGDPAQRGDALAGVVELVAKAGRHESALEIARSIPPPDSIISPDAKSRALTYVVKASTKAGDHHRALEIARSIAEPYWQGSALVGVAEALARAGHHDEALETARSITYLELQSRALARVTESLVAAGLHDQATAVLDQALDTAYSATDLEFKNKALVETVNALVEAGHHDQAAEVFSYVSEIPRAVIGAPNQAWALNRVAEALAKSGHHDEALDIARSTRHPFHRSWVLTRVAEAQVAAGLHDQAAAVLDQALEVAASVADLSQRSEALVRAAGALLTAGRRDRAAVALDRALEAARSITDAGQHGRALADAVEAFTMAENHDQAIDVALSIGDPFELSRALATAAEGLARAGHHDRADTTLDQALGAARAVTDPRWRSEALAALAEAVTRAGQRDLAAATLDQALDAADTVSDPDWRSRALGSVAVVLARAGHHDRAVATAQSMTDLYEQSQVVADVAEAIAVAGHYSRAAEVASSVVRSDQRGRALMAIAKTPAAEAGGHAVRTAATALQCSPWHTNPRDLCLVSVSAAKAVIAESVLLSRR
ncbi:hypothetical protein AB0H12_34990 [Actinosynnema sp. NPDC023794]